MDMLEVMQFRIINTDYRHDSGCYRLPATGAAIKLPTAKGGLFQSNTLTDNSPNAVNLRLYLVYLKIHIFRPRRIFSFPNFNDIAPSQYLSVPHKWILEVHAIPDIRFL